jgi:translation elongation factor P/translation initiation factor 5A
LKIEYLYFIILTLLVKIMNPSHNVCNVFNRNWWIGKNAHPAYKISCNQDSQNNEYYYDSDDNLDENEIQKREKMYQYSQDNTYNKLDKFDDYSPNINNPIISSNLDKFPESNFKKFLAREIKYWLRCSKNDETHIIISKFINDVYLILYQIPEEIKYIMKDNDESNM